jgi:hypothetical protein
MDIGTAGKVTSLFEVLVVFAVVNSQLHTGMVKYGIWNEHLLDAVNYRKYFILSKRKNCSFKTCLQLAM